MEDAHTLADKFMGDASSAFFGVYDGHGGSQVASLAALRLHQYLAEELRAQKSVRDAFASAYDRVDIDARNEDMFATGSTAVTCFVRNEECGRMLYTANAGDARAVLGRASGAIRLSYDHKGTDKAEQKRVESCGGFVLNGRVSGMLAVTRALGDHMLKDSVTSEPFFHQIALTPDDNWLIVACDGLWDVVTDAEAVAHIQGCQLASQACSMLMQLALTKKTRDNVTIIAVHL